MTRRGSARTPAHQPKSVGQGLVEFALIVPLAITLLFGVIEAARLFQSWETIQNAVEEAARYTATGQGYDQGTGVRESQITGLARSASRLANHQRLGQQQPGRATSMPGSAAPVRRMTRTKQTMPARQMISPGWRSSTITRSSSRFLVTRWAMWLSTPRPWCSTSTSRARRAKSASCRRLRSRLGRRPRRRSP